MSSVAGQGRSPSFDSGVPPRSAASALGALALALAGLAGAWSLDGRLAAARLAVVLPPTGPVLGLLLDPSPMIAVAALPLPSGFATVPTAAADASIMSEGAVPDIVPVDTSRVDDARPAGEAVLPPSAIQPLLGEGAELVPFPQPRPLDLVRTAPAAPVRLPMRPRFARPASGAPLAPVDNRGFFEKLFGFNRPAGASPAMAYAPAETTQVGRSLGLSSSFPAPSRGGGAAVYDITAHTVTLPDGTRLEAHSGLGEHLDDPGGVHLRMRGATPPQTYALSLREKLFHGVRALRLTPVGGGHVYGRDGLLAHTYMLGPNGQSNGCVSFRDYDSFLQAFERGHVTRLVVVARS